MTELVTITPDAGLDAKGNPTPGGTPLTLTPLEVAPGNTALAYGIGGDLDSVEFTVYLPLRARIGDPPAWTAVDEAATQNFSILVRGRYCRGRAQRWESGGRGGVVVLAHSATGKAA